MGDLFIGLMSGTSLDGVDGVLVDFSGGGMQVLAFESQPFTAEDKAELLALNASGEDELHRAALSANALAVLYSDVVHQLLFLADRSTDQVQAIGAHGQTVRHRPGEFDGIGYTLQLNNPALLAELTDISVVADFRSRDVAAGGQGAPLVPAFHSQVFGRAGEAVAVLNIGGISNLSLLDGQILGFDCGPGNALMDHWCQLHTGQPYDADGAWAASGTVHPALLAALLEEPYLAKTPPKSTGRDLFNPPWLSSKLQGFAGLTPADVQATITEFTARAVSACMNSYGNNSILVIVCGGGALNGYLMQRLQALLPTMQVQSSAAHGLPPLQVEAVAFAWLARQTVLGLPGNLASVTGARGERILGAVYPA
nr:anhydro-N-acetylmuramic acid kinase [uncultured Albidiferax sp.]